MNRSLDHSGAFQGFRESKAWWSVAKRLDDPDASYEWHAQGARGYESGWAASRDEAVGRAHDAFRRLQEYIT